MKEWEEIPLPICTCGQVARDPVDKSVVSSPHAPLFQTKDISFSDELWTAIVDGLDLLTARVGALESRIDQINAPVTELTGAGADPQPDQEVADQ